MVLCCSLCLRVFCLRVQFEPVNKVGSGEAQAHEEVMPVSESAAHAVRPPGFESAARQEHQNEAAALRNLQKRAVSEPRLPCCLLPRIMFTLGPVSNPLSLARTPGRPAN